MSVAGRLSRAIVLVTMFSSSALAQGPAPLTWTHEEIPRTKLGTPRSVYVATPEGYGQGTRRYPVIVILDANDPAQFRLAVANVGFMADRGMMPPMIVVGVPNGADRTHDLTPPATGGTAQRFRTAGGSSAFADFLVSDVVPMVRAKYRTLPSTILVGHSFGGLFALQVAAQRPGTFAGIVAISPALWWNDTSVVVDYADAIAKSPAPLRLFATSGGLEPEINVVTQRFAARMDSLKPAKVAFRYKYYPDDDHGMTPAPSLVEGLRFLFEPMALSTSPVARLGAASDSAAVMRALEETEAYYRDGAKHFGLDDKLPEQALNMVGYRVMQELRKPALAISLFKRNVALYPESQNVHDSLGDGYLAQGDTANAKASFQRAIDTAVRRKEVPQPETIVKLNQLERAGGRGMRE
jgi:predicted alpha/beta superfamily hydrolase